jgi:hypothetical protein
MRSFFCDGCGGRLHYENTVCLSCGSALGFLPGEMRLRALQPTGDPGWWQVVGESSGARWKKCRNYEVQNVCNWMVPEDDGQAFCRSCTLNDVIPDLSVWQNRVHWARMECAKRRLLFSLLALRLPFCSKQEDPVRGLAFRFLADPDDDFLTDRRILTGHDGGIITINIAEADDAVREKMRLDLREVYRTVLGHFRHEAGHYFWDRFFADSGREEEVRVLFGDERVDYAAALQRHYANGAPPGWEQRHISSYAAAHAWEDWAETWAHYLHITDTLETAHCNGMQLRYPDGLRGAPDPYAEENYSRIAEAWLALRFVMNSLNRSMGLPDPYPFVMSTEVVRKLEFIHSWIWKGYKEKVSSRV